MIDNEDGTGTSTARALAIAAVNEPPVPEFEVDVVGTVATFDASSSLDPDGFVSAFVWSFGEDTAAEGRTAAHDFGAPGSYPVTLTVVDDSGSTRSLVRTVSVADDENLPPVAAFTATPDGLTVNFDAEESGDSDGLIVDYACGLRRRGRRHGRRARPLLRAAG